ncbi:discoidin domain-containing protein [Desertimonas flava]|uniref:discoidin domain-containing protein n=1 Tax=Desertimonas flava TaxID=2064846 RepID=UPI0013C4EBA0|nr:discoidin domain-containing protein [Desertimonas flava]
MTLAMAALALTLTPLGDDDGPTATSEAVTVVRPFAEVQAGEFVFEADPTNPERAIFHVTTTEPMICAIVWGPTEELGNFNNSLSMNGTGIVDHDVALPGAVAGTTYYFVVEGFTADGTIYRSDMDTFTIPEAADAAPADTAAERGPNLSLEGTVVDVSSEFSDSYAATNAIDDSGLTEWSSAGDGDDAFITIELAEPREVAGVEFITRSMLDGTAITETFTVTVDDGETFGPFPAATAAEPNVAPIDATGQTFRFDVDTSTGGNVGAVEVRILAAP